MGNEKVVVALDLGSQNLKAIIGAFDENKNIEVKGIGVATCGGASSCGIGDGVIKNIELTVRNIEEVLANAEAQYGEEVEHVVVGFSGKHIESKNDDGSVVVSGKDHEIDLDDIERVWEQAKTKVEPLPEIKTVVRQIPRWYNLDGETKIKEPVGMSGVKLGVDMHIITCNAQQLKNIKKCVNKANLILDDTIPNFLTSSRAVMDSDEAELGCVVIDMGAGTTDIAIYVDNAIYHSEVLEIGGDIVTKDIAAMLKTPKNKAELLKIKYGVAYLDDSIDKDMEFEIPSVGGRAPSYVSIEDFYEIIHSRMEEIVEVLYARIKEQKISFDTDLSAGIILTGGMANLYGLDKLMENIFGVQVRVGKPFGIKGLDEVAKPEFASAVGLLKYGVENYEKYRENGGIADISSFLKKTGNFFKRMFGNE